MPIPLLQVDAFTDKPFCGNPAAVCLLDNEKDPPGKEGRRESHLMVAANHEGIEDA